MATTNAQKEELRHAALEVLAARPGTALDLTQIRRRIDQGKVIEFACDNTDLRQALSVLSALEFVRISHDALGSTEYFEAEAAGILAHERGR